MHGARLRVTWLDESMGQQFGRLNNVTEASIQFLGTQLARLKQVNKTKLHEPRILSRHEFEMIVRDILRPWAATAMKTAIETGLPKDDADNDNYDDDDDDEDDIEDDCQSSIAGCKGQMCR
jgi:hypothetical protein